MSIADDALCDEEITLMSAPRPLARAWLWRPWYAKLWWTGMIVYWVGKLASLCLPALVAFYASALAGFLNFAFFPTVVLVILGLGFARAWFAWSDWELVPPSHEEMFPKRSVGRWRDPYTDPLDPKSGTLWIGSPENQAKLFNRRGP